MKSIEQLQAEHAEQFRALQAEHAIGADAAASGLPEPKRVHGFAPHAWLIYPHAQTLADALQVFKAATIVPYSQWRTDAGHVVHAPELPADKGAQYEAGPYACGIKVDTAESFGPSAEIRFFARLQSGRVVAVHVSFGSGHVGNCPGLSAARVARLSENNGKRFNHNPALHGMADRCTYWATGSRENHSVLAHWCAEDFEPMPGADCAHALGMLQNLSDTLKV